MSEEKTNIENVTKEVKDQITTDITNIIIKHEEDIGKLINDISLISDFIKKVPKKKLSNFFKFITDKEYVIVGVVVIGIVAMFVIPDPVTVLSSIVSGLFGIATGRVIDNKDDE